MAGKSLDKFRSEHPLAIVWRAARIRPNEHLSAGEAASTLFRFFRSHHVADLRIIFLGAVFVAAAHFLTASAFAYEDPTFLKYFGPAIPLYGAVMAWTYLSAITRLGVVDLFACEIRTLCRVGSIFQMSQGFLNQHKRCVEMIANHKGKERLSEKPPGESKGFVSQEDYFPVFTGNSHDLEALEAPVVGNITEFYTYMKSARDMLRREPENDSAESAKPIYENLIYVLYLGYESARKAIEALIEFEPTRADNIIIMLLTELQCYAFLQNHFTNVEYDKLRSERLKLREKGYKTDIPKLWLKVKAHADEADWFQAAASLSELDKEYNDAFDERLGDAVDRLQRESEQSTKVQS
jgi:hypothetical protein